jgi:hypothetical protein
VTKPIIWRTSVLRATGQAHIRYGFAVLVTSAMATAKRSKTKAMPHIRFGTT